jgi:hypothetical protein
MRLLAILAFIPCLAFGQGLTPSPPGGGKKVTNYVLRSNVATSADSPVAPWTFYNSTLATGSAASGAQGGGVWTAVTTTDVLGSFYQTVSTPSGTLFVASSWAAKSSGTGSATVSLSCSPTTPSACSCRRSGAGSCTATVVSNRCAAIVTDLGTTPEWISAFTTCTATTAPAITLSGGAFNISTGTSLFTGSQITAGSSAGKLCVTTTVSRTCK